MNLSNIHPNLPQIPVNYGPSSQIHNYVTHHVQSSQQPNLSQPGQQRQQRTVPVSPPRDAPNVYLNSNRSQQREQTFSPWGQYGSTTLGTGITDGIQQPRSTYAATSNTTHSTPNSYTAEFYGQEDHQQSLGFGAMSVTSSIINQPHTLQAASAIQSALNNLNSNQLGIATAPSLVAAAPPIPVQSILNQPNKENIDKNAGKEIMITAKEISKSLSLPNSKTEAVNTSSNFYLAPGSANHGGSYRQTLNPAIYNAYRMSTTSSPSRNTSTVVTGHRSNVKSPVVHVIAETVYRIPSQSAGANGGARLAFRKQDRFDKTALYKTELCTNWMLTGSCTYGNKCHFAHGVEDLKPRMRVENYKTQPCCDPAREGCRRCMYGRRCNYCHPGEAIRRPHPTPYYDKDYYKALRRDFGKDNEFPFGIYV
eukprot:1127066_1